MAPSHKELSVRAKKQKPTQRDDFELRDLIKIEWQFPIPAVKGARPLNASWLTAQPGHIDIVRSQSDRLSRRRRWLDIITTRRDRFMATTVSGSGSLTV